MLNPETILKMADALYNYQVKIRRHLHQNPELSYEEFKTTAFIKRELKRHGIKSQKINLKTGAVGLINPRHKEAVALRTDIDALPVTECTGLSYKSRNPGIMHACGHDVHMATVLGTAAILNKLKDIIPGCVKIFFQPAEEAPPGGAEMLIREGVMQSPPVNMVFGLHVDPTLPVGNVSFRDGPVMASVMDVDLIVHGIGGHAALPHRAVDAISVACEIIESLQKVISRETDPMSESLISFGRIEGGTARNIITDRVKLSGTIRTLDKKVFKQIPRLIRRNVKGICSARGAKCDINFLSGYPVLVNHSSANRILFDCYAETFGKSKIASTPQTLGGEDFAFYILKTPGAMFRLGIRNDKIGANKSWHSPEFKVDERAIYYGTTLLSMAVLRHFGVI